MPTIPTDLLDRLRQHGQDHVFRFFDRLGEDEQRRLVEQIQALDLEQLSYLYSKRGKSYAVPEADQIEPVSVIPYDSPDNRSRRESGERALREGKVAALLVAGGQGSRLGFDHPKGMYPVGPVSKKTLFRVFAEKVRAITRRYGKPMPLLVMTSPATHEETLDYFRDNGNLGLSTGEVFFFMQATMPALDMNTGRLLLEAPDRLFLSPDGHGGTLTALATSGLLARMKERGIEQVFYFQVDNALVKIADPTFLGHHLHANAEVSSKIVAKRSATERVGVFAQVKGRCTLVEYSDLPVTLAAQTDSTGRLRLWAGSPAIHLFSVAFLERMTCDPEGIPFHVAKKKVPHIDEAGQPVDPQTENALKFERFIFDVLPKADRWTVVETIREDEFAPLKNADGDDSPATVEALLLGQARRWIVQAGGTVASETAVEISPLFALDAEELAAKLPPGTRIDSPYSFSSE